MSTKKWKKYIDRKGLLVYRKENGDEIRITKNRRDIIVWDVELNHQDIFVSDTKQKSLEFAKEYMEKN